MDVRTGTAFQTEMATHAHVAVLNISEFMNTGCLKSML